MKRLSESTMARGGLDAPVILSPEANTGAPLKGDFQQMAKRRFQDPKPFREGSCWWIKPRIDDFSGGEHKRQQQRMKVAPADVSEREAKRMASELLRPMNQGLETIGSATPFGSYVRGTYRPTVLPLLASTTRAS